MWCSSETLDFSRPPPLNSADFTKALAYWENQQPLDEEDDEGEEEMDELEMCRLHGKNAWQSMYREEEVCPGLVAIKSMVTGLHVLTGELQMKLEPFQLEAFRAAVCSRAMRLLKEELYKYAGDVLQSLGVIGTVEMQTLGQTQIVDIFNRWGKRFVGVVAPRRNGKSKAGKIFVAVNAVAEEGARIVLIAHQINAVLLYKDDILQYLEVLRSATGSFSIKCNSNVIKLEFRDRKRANSTIYFVAGGLNVSMKTLSHFIASSRHVP